MCGHCTSTAVTRYLGYIRVAGFVMEHAADAFPVPQGGAISASRGHHWIIEDNTVRKVNAVGIDIGLQLFDLRDGVGTPTPLYFPEASCEGKHWNTDHCPSATPAGCRCRPGDPMTTRSCCWKPCSK